MMPKRLFDFEAFWKSKKILSVDRKYWDFYVHLVGLAQPNGCFEAGPQLVWAQIYAPTRPDEFTLAEIEEGMAQFEAAGMLKRYEVDGKQYAMPVCIDKPGRLPQKFKVNPAGLPPLPPAPPARVVPKLHLEAALNQKCKEAFYSVEERTYASVKKTFKEEFRKAEGRFGYDLLLTKFDEWCQAGYAGKYPITDFLKAANAEPILPPVFAPTESGSPAPLAVPVSPTQNVEDRIALLSDNTVFFQPTHRTVLAGVIRKYGDDVVVEAFREFLSALPSDADRRWSGRDFTEQAATRVRTILRTRKLRDKANADLEASLAASKLEAERRLARLAPPEGESELD